MEPVANKHPHPVRNGIIVTVVGGLILSAIPLSRRFLEKTMSWVWAGVSWMWTALLSHYPVPGCVPRFVEKERRPPLRHQGIRSGGNLRVFENLAQTLVAVDAP